ncbi:MULTISPECIES: helix-turn-helix transcriptional regulator [unclassified Mesorhizobium]|uniref:helix-turn-helix domain-containing protein n=1 Tax=unclassified Mesorhizobium TaxID=325217 RepID=UPI000F757475|nr:MULTISPECIES: helix-turn-helix transcriptional regulator [unclassified Mesorhizobium]AZO09588.1 XRE family transcriptional regulator [Mesorhizobium sp. M3A.F.Ca.ET.080.04.2.1]RWB68605.1 MAG: XRE family transcriptional regulator [Mesorhizobium sp.]RWB82246.1 MAG: XRE family transcriptional regulator [Mesorhizobium sp.]
MSKLKRSTLFRVTPTPELGHHPHPADVYVGRQIAMVRVQSDVSQAQLARSIGISIQQLQKYENARNRVSASMIYEIGRSLGVPVSRFFNGLPENGESTREASVLPVERIDFIASAEGRHLIERLVQLPPRVRARVSALIAAIGEELAISRYEEGQSHGRQTGVS